MQRSLTGASLGKSSSLEHNSVGFQPGHLPCGLQLIKIPSGSLHPSMSNRLPFLHVLRPIRCQHKIQGGPFCQYRLHNQNQRKNADDAQYSWWDHPNWAGEVDVQEGYPGERGWQFGVYRGVENQAQPVSQIYQCSLRQWPAELSAAFPRESEGWDVDPKRTEGNQLVALDLAVDSGSVSKGTTRAAGRGKIDKNKYELLQRDRVLDCGIGGAVPVEMQTFCQFWGCDVLRGQEMIIIQWSQYSILPNTDTLPFMAHKWHLSLK